MELGIRNCDSGLCFARPFFLRDIASLVHFFLRDIASLVLFFYGTLLRSSFFFYGTLLRSSFLNSSRRFGEHREFYFLGIFFARSCWFFTTWFSYKDSLFRTSLCALCALCEEFSESSHTKKSQGRRTQVPRQNK